MLGQTSRFAAAAAILLLLLNAQPTFSMTDLCTVAGLPRGTYTKLCIACVSVRVSYEDYHRCKLQCRCGVEAVPVEIDYDRRWNADSLPLIRFVEQKFETYT